MDRFVLPGDKLASIEEYIAGNGTFDDGESIRASIAGQVKVNSQEQSVSIRGPQNTAPNIGDIVIGDVAITLSSRLAVYIRFVNGVRVFDDLECVLATRNIRKRIVALVGDVMALKITSVLNGDIHAKVDEPQLGVLFTKCRKCGKKVMIHRDAVKCIECGWIDDRKLSSEFGNVKFLNTVTSN